MTTNQYKKPITDEFDDMRVYGKRFTSHHKDLLFSSTRKIIVNFLNWVHWKGYTPVPHVDYQPRYWKKKDKQYTEDDLFIKYIRHAAKEKKSEEKSNRQS